jgi:hypothetical protein
MNMKLGQATSDQTNAAQSAHYAAESAIMGHVKTMSLAGKQLLASRMPAHADAAETDCKSQ